jgi:CheY-like chemotaxis protein
MHGGRAYSDGIGCGSEFVIRLPLLDQQAARSRRCRAPPADSRKPLQVLVVDDNQDAADSLTALLELDGFEVRTVYDGGAAIAAVQRQAPDIVIMDLGMPAWTATKRRARCAARRRRTHPDAGPDRLGPGRRAPPHHGGRLRPPPGQAGGAGAIIRLAAPLMTAA